MDKRAALQQLRKYTFNKLTEDGIYLVYRSRYEQSARAVESLVRQLGGDVEVTKTGKTTYRNLTASKTWKVVFTISIEADAYLTGHLKLQEVA